MYTFLTKITEIILKQRKFVANQPTPCTLCNSRQARATNLQSLCKRVMLYPSLYSTRVYIVIVIYLHFLSYYLTFHDCQIVPPSNMELFDTSHPAGYNGSERVKVLVNRPHNMTCETTRGAKPPVNIEWLTETARFSQGGRTDQSASAQPSPTDRTDQSAPDRRLKVSSREVTVIPTLADHLSWIACNVTHPALDSELVTFVKLDVQGTSFYLFILLG